MKKIIVGIDEVGRGSLAGPVTVAAVAVLARSKLPRANGELGKLRDSKKLSPKRREKWSAWLCSHPQIDYAIARVYPRQIEKRNISAAANLAASRAFSRLAARRQVSGVGRRVFLDGGLYLGNRKSQTASGLNAKTVVRGDQKIAAIKAASIIAKVHRDRAMIRLAKQYPQYSFEVHKGYGTKAHMRAIKKHGPSEAHRLTFLS